MPPSASSSAASAASSALDEALGCVRVGPGDFDVSTEIAALRAGDVGVGAVVAFVGTVREWRGAQTADEAAGDAVRTAEPAADRVAASVMELEHYPGMTERSIARLIVEARMRFDVRGVRVIHRVGPLAVTDQIVLVAVTSAHRGQAFQCAEFLMDWLKTQAPFWKKESAGGQGHWVDARIADDEAAARWGGSGPRNASS